MATTDALGSVTAEAILSPEALPAFRRSTMDGYAVRAADTYGASESLPAILTVVGEVAMGQPATVTLERGQAAVIHTGGMVPEAADAVVQLEMTQAVGSGEIEVLRPVAIGQNTIQPGEDVGLGAVLLPAGHCLRPQDLGGLLALGVATVAVRPSPRVGILASGDEVVPPETAPRPGQIRDINSYTIAGQVVRAGGTPVLGGIIRDDLASLQAAARKLLAETDMLVMTAGSSVSARDVTAAVIGALGSPGLLFHGVATRPGKPTIGGVAGGKPTLGLPGNPVSAMIQFDMFGRPALQALLGVTARPRPDQTVARLTQNIASESGREDYVAVRLEETAEGTVAIPIFGKSNLIRTLIEADGLVMVPLNKGGLVAGETVVVTRFG